LVFNHRAVLQNLHRIAAGEIDQGLIVAVAIGAGVGTGDLVADNLKVGILVVFEIHILEVAFAAVVLFHHRDQVGGAVQIIEVAAVRIDVAVHAGNPGIFVIGVVGQVFVQGTNAG